MGIRILLVEDEPALRLSLKKLLELHPYQVEVALNLQEARQRLNGNAYDVILLDLKLPDGNGMELLKAQRERLEERTIIITANATIPSAIEAIRTGAYYYLEKPLDEELLFIQIEKIAQLWKLRKQNQTLKKELSAPQAGADLVFQSQAMEKVVEMAKRLARSDNSILIQGETGVGKEVMAKFIHAHSPRKSAIFLPVNCSSIPESLFESELFGFRKGAFTGALGNYNGRFVQAHNGTLFLDEIGEMPLPMQAKLLRVLEDGLVYQLGNDQPVRVDVRLVAATNKDLWHEVETGRFRKDLFYRLKSAIVHVPALRERRQDILPLFQHFMELFNQLFEKNIATLSSEAQHYLVNYAWDGNVRELKNTVKSIFALRDEGPITLDDLLITLHAYAPEAAPRLMTLAAQELEYIRQVVQTTQGNIKKAAEILGISRTRLYRKLNGIPEFKSHLRRRPE